MSIEIVTDDSLPTNPRFEDLTGKRFGALVVVKFLKRVFVTDQIRPLWLCKCDCETTIQRLSNAIKISKSCYGPGCKERRGISPNVHPLWDSWNHIKSRCNSKTNKDYQHYGRRGISLCLGWFDFQTFCRDVGTRPKGLTIDRIDNNGNYSCGKCKECESNGWPLNVRWANWTTQQRNKRNNAIVEFNGQRLCIAEWSEQLSMDKATLHSRLYRYGWSIERALTETVRKRRRDN